MQEVKQKVKKRGTTKRLYATYLTSTTITDKDELESRDLLLFSHCLCVYYGGCGIKEKRYEGEKEEKKIEKKKKLQMAYVIVFGSQGFCTVLKQRLPRQRTMEAQRLSIGT